MPSTVLLIEDDREIRHWLRVVLEAEGYRLFFEETGKQGVAEAAARQPDLVLLDLGLPDVDGVEVIQLGNGCRPAIPIRYQGVMPLTAGIHHRACTIQGSLALEPVADS